MSRLGQHFLFDPSILKRIVDVSGVKKEDTVVEIGPGHGRLTRLLSEIAARVIAIELDHLLIKKLKDELKDYSNIELVEGDALKYPYFNLGPFKVVSNIPYYITTPLIFRLLEADNLLSMTLTVQKEVAMRIVAVPGTKDYGVLSLMVQYRAIPEIKFFIPRGAFRPVPKVDSAVIHIKMRDSLLKPGYEDLFKKIVKTAFSKRRKTILNSLKGVFKDFNIESILESCGIDPGRRPETLRLEEFIKIAERIRFFERNNK
ncbi:MAG: 16S rRNA (adenine(1518)-N(6)/adenine(1519)-N(6))-dimethyltransferase RsmA [Thermodesulfovibrionales bacterium]|nr:16S rRNA (adenine(1518)-N(6)/adenine(1519)-N(6))-dimethyltransferase RsmA [Thermodesulfovibrionales bacterium]